MSTLMFGLVSFGCGALAGCTLGIALEFRHMFKEPGGTAMVMYLLGKKHGEENRSRSEARAEWEKHKEARRP